MDQNKIKQEVENLRVFFQKDGGDIELIQTNEEDEVYLRLKGQCRICPVNKEITGEGVEAILKEKVPAVKRVYLDKG